MLYYIIPPIVIVLSLAFLISFLFRKFSAQGQENLEMLENLNEVGAKKEIGNAVWSFFSGFWFRILEKLMGKMKLFSLKMHNTSNNWFHSIKNKREQRSLAQAEQKVEDEAVLMKNVSTSAVVENQAEITIKRKSRLENFSIRRRFVRKPVILAAKMEAPIKTESMEKNRLEDALIKRIAVNPKDIEAYERLGDYYSDTKNFKDALECYKQVTKLSPRHFKAKAKMRGLEKILKR